VARPQRPDLPAPGTIRDHARPGPATWPARSSRPRLPGRRRGKARPSPGELPAPRRTRRVRHRVRQDPHRPIRPPPRRLDHSAAAGFTSHSFTATSWTAITYRRGVSAALINSGTRRARPRPARFEPVSQLKEA